MNGEFGVRLTRFVWSFLFVLVASFLGTAANADSWSPPEQSIIESRNGTARVTIIPRDLSSPLEYFRDKLDDKESPGLPKKARNTRPSAVVETKSETGVWQWSWEVELINEVAPVSAIVSDDGQYLVTFDNWHRVGYGATTIVRYHQEKGLIGKHDLQSFLPPYYLEALPRSVSSRSWKKGKPSFIDGKLRVDIIVPSRDSRADRTKARTVEFLVDLEKGHVTKRDTEAWVNALLSALSVQELRTEAETARILRLLSPLVAKAEMTERDWHQYMRDAWHRLVKHDDNSATKHLRRLDHPKYQATVGWIKDEFADMVENRNEEEWFFSDVSIASSDQDNLVNLLTEIASTARPGDFRWGRALIVVDERHWSELKRVFANTGLTMILADPKQPIASSKKRLKQLFNRGPDPEDEFDFLDAR